MADAVRTGARNLLSNCAGLRAGDRLLVLAEDPSEGFYDAAIADAIMAEAASMGIAASRRPVPFSPAVAPPDPDILSECLAADRTLFLARMGDQLRFSPAMGKIRPVVSYALDEAMLGSAFGRAHHHAFVALKDALNAALAAAQHIRVTCPLGTDFEGPGAVFPATGAEVTVTRFPLSVFTPVPARPYRGRIAQAGFLTGTGSTYYEPYTIPLDDVLFIHFDGTRILGFEGAAADVRRAHDHYRRVAGDLGIDWDHVHSWHAGIHPGCAYPGRAGATAARWSGSAFGNPRILHFHTCGAYAPGEISVNVIDPTIRLDGVAVWDRGRLRPELVAGGAEILARYPCAAAAFAEPAQDIGLGPDGRLTPPA